MMLDEVEGESGSGEGETGRPPLSSGPASLNPLLAYQEQVDESADLDPRHTESFWE